MDGRVGVQDGHVLCPICAAFSSQLAPGPGGRPLASCPNCGSLERHRFLYLLLQSFRRQALLGDAVCDVAPSSQLSPLIQSLRPNAYISIDYDPAADGRLVKAAASLTQLPLKDASVGLLVCLDVLEHIPDDHEAMSEIRRVLVPGGIALLQVPWRDGPTDEDPNASEADRLRRFGQRDHVRYYGEDFIERLRVASLAVSVVTPGALLGLETCGALGLLPSEQIWVCSPPNESDDSLGAHSSYLAAPLADLITRATFLWKPPSSSSTGPRYLAANQIRRRAWIPKPLRRPLRRAYKSLLAIRS